MYLKQLKLENFRNFEKVELEFKAEPGIQICLGQNAMGKTNLLESIFLLAFPRSFRVQSPSDLVKFGQNYFLISAEFKDLELTFGYQKKPIRKTYKKNGVEIPVEEYLTNLQTVLFTPEDVEILNDSPAIRRRFLDTILSQIDREYFLALLNYTKVLKQRNALLKRIKTKQAQINEINFWNGELAKQAAIIHSKRLELVQYFQSKLSGVYQEIADNQESEIELNFKYSGHSRTDIADNYEDLMKELLDEDITYDIEVGHTTIGPHRDNFSLHLNQKLVSEFCSRGEKRSFMLALKIIELEFLEEKSGSKPILLLDDVFSELDKNRRLKLLELASKYQTIISTVEESYFSDFDGEVSVFYFEKNGKIRYNN